MLTSEKVERKIVKRSLKSINLKAQPIHHFVKEVFVLYENEVQLEIKMEWQNKKIHPKLIQTNKMARKKSEPEL